MTQSFLSAGKCAARGRKHASAQQKTRRGNPARAFGALSVNALFWKILVTRVKKFFAEFARSIERAENSAHFGKIAPGTAGGGVGQRRINAYPGCRFARCGRRPC